MLLEYLNEDGRATEPICRGIGSGWSTCIPSYNPLEIIANMRLLLEKKDLEPMDPWYRGFDGKIEKSEEGVYIVSGAVEYTDNDDTFIITELPIGTWTHGYKKFLASMTEGGSPKVKDPLIEDFKQDGDGAIVKIVIKMKQEKKDLIKDEKQLFQKFRLTNTICTNNMHLFDYMGKLRKFETPKQIMEEFYDLRMKYYVKRKEYILPHLKRILLILDNKLKFIAMVVADKIKLGYAKVDELFTELKANEFTRMRKKAEPKVIGACDEQEYDNMEELETSSQEEAT